MLARCDGWDVRVLTWNLTWTREHLSHATPTKVFLNE